jgi:hypothetical protein
MSNYYRSRLADNKYTYRPESSYDSRGDRYSSRLPDYNRPVTSADYSRPLPTSDYGRYLNDSWRTERPPLTYRKSYTDVRYSGDTYTRSLDYYSTKPAREPYNAYRREPFNRQPSPAPSQDTVGMINSLVGSPRHTGYHLPDVADLALDDDNEHTRRAYNYTSRAATSVAFNPSTYERKPWKPMKSASSLAMGRPVAREFNGSKRVSSDSYSTKVEGETMPLPTSFREHSKKIQFLQDSAGNRDGFAKTDVNQTAPTTNANASVSRSNSPVNRFKLFSPELRSDPYKPLHANTTFKHLKLITLELEAMLKPGNGVASLEAIREKVKKQVEIIAKLETGM